MKVLSLLLLLIIVSSFAVAQPSPQAQLLDEFGYFNCEDFLARMDFFYIRLNNETASKGFLVVSGDKSVVRKKLAAALLLESAVVAREYDRSRVELIKGVDSGPLKVQLWLASPGAKSQDFKENSWDLTFRRDEEPFMLDSDMSQICPSAPFDSVAKELLEANPSGMIYVIVHGHNQAERRRELARTRKRIPDISLRRVRYFLRNSRIGYSDYYFAVGKRSRNEFKSFF